MDEVGTTITLCCEQKGLISSFCFFATSKRPGWTSRSKHFKVSLCDKIFAFLKIFLDLLYYGLLLSVSSFPLVCQCIDRPGENWTQPTIAMVGCVEE